MAKRGVTDSYIKSVMEKKAKLDRATAASSAASSRAANPYLQAPVQPEQALRIFLTQCRSSARDYATKSGSSVSSSCPCEIEIRLGLLTVPHSLPARRVTSTGAKKHGNLLVSTFDCSSVQPRCLMEAGVSRLHFLQWTSAGVSELGPLAQALGVMDPVQVKQDMLETESVETVYAGYANNQRVCFAGEHSITSASHSIGKMESKEKLAVMDLAVPAAPYDIRCTISSEKVTDAAVQNQPPPNWTMKRIKRRRSYSRRDKSMAWQIDVTEVTTTHQQSPSSYQPAEVHYEIELELVHGVLLQLVQEDTPEKVQKLTTQLAQQLWWIISQMNPMADALNVQEALQDHPNPAASQMARAHCAALKRFMDSDGKSTYNSPLLNINNNNSGSNHNHLKFIGCMPVNFSRHHLDEIQRSPDQAYFVSEKTDGVRHLLVFTGDTAVLLDRTMTGKQPISLQQGQDPFAPILDLIQPGTVFDGEVVMNRSKGRKPRPIFIVFDVMAISPTQPVLHLSFEERLRHLRQASFRTPQAPRDMFDPKLVADLSVALPLVRKNFCQRTDLDELLSHVTEERGMRIYRNGDLHNHLTDGIIFQPNRPYVLGTDRALLKWKYLDTVTIDLELLPLQANDEEAETLRVGCLGEEQTIVDMTRHVFLPTSERVKMEADRFETGGKIAEVGFDPETGEWYYLTMRADKIAPNHISTVLGTLLELSESLTTDELRYRMSVPAGTRDTYRKDMKGMLKQLLSHQRKKLNASKAPTTGGR